MKPGEGNEVSKGDLTTIGNIAALEGSERSGAATGTVSSVDPPRINLLSSRSSKICFQSDISGVNLCVSC